MGTARERKTGDRPVSSSFKIAAIALVFLIIGYQVALFMFRASVTGIAAHRDRPDTVYVFERAMVDSIVTGMPPHSPAGDTSTVFVHRKSEHAPVAEAVAKKYSRREPESFRFDPNTVSVDDLERLGFSARQALSIENYRAKGGRFHRKEDFARSFVVSDTIYRRLEAFIDIPMLDLNTADSAAFDALPGIGPYFASRIVAYRRKLCGFSYPEQLMDIPKFDRQRYDALKDLVTVIPVQPYGLWSLPEDSLRLHPYIRTSAHGIVLYRDNTPVGEWSIDGLKASGIINGLSYEKLSRCNIAKP